MKSALILALLPCLGCIDIDSGSSASEGDDVDDEGGHDNDDCKIEGSAIGVVGLELALGDVTVIFDSWTGKEDSPGEYVGFSFHTSTGSAVGYVVKSGGDLSHSTEFSWTNPNGLAGPAVPGISNVDYCEECEDGSCDDGGGDGDGDGCENPDGCDPGDGGDGDGDDGGCTTDDECATGEFCEGGTCQPIIG
jgi:hypothetical protein